VSLRAAGVSDVGRKRDANEDRFHIDLGRGIFIVADGIGGHAAGEQAAETAIAAMTERLARQTGSVSDRLREAITIANNGIYRLAATRTDWHGMACVLTAAIVNGDRAVVGHVGDSRLYRLINGHIEKITPDHSPVGEREDAKEISELEAMRHPRRNEVFRDVGSEPHEAHDDDFVFVKEIDVPPGAALLLCSDGLTDMLPSETIRDVVASYAGSPDAVAGALVAAANAAGGKDNVTVVYVEREGDGVLTHAPAGGARRRGVGAWAIAVWVVLAMLAGFAAGSWRAGRWKAADATAMLAALSGSTISVRDTESISVAIASAGAGATIVVEPGEYRERLTLRDGIRVVSRVPRGAVIRLPGDASESDAAVVAAGVAGAELSGFRIVGDAATPLGIGIVTRDAAVKLVDLDISGATSTAADLGSGDVTLSGSDVHDNRGAALMIRANASPRLANNAFSRNASAGLPVSAFVVEAGATPRWSQNVFNEPRPAFLSDLDEPTRSDVMKNNWFVAPQPSRGAVPAFAPRGSERGR
jgi:serine/threonine protein phosphatase PrpC